MLRRILMAWRLRVWGSGNQSGNARITLAPEPLGHALGEEAALGCSTPHSSLGKVRGRGWEGPGWMGARWEEREGMGRGWVLRTHYALPRLPGSPPSWRPFG